MTQTFQRPARSVAHDASARRLTWPLILDDGECLACIVKKKRCLATGAQIAEKTRPTSHPAIAQPAPVKKPTQNQTPI